ncbi:hypothetical protein GALMADRAFT_1208270 [Galerina marginata CBS 339.88]|uniref:Uncharacterized protein n=1 Tax=Galerina marginata (strain CBS 339.88) TaxID=685588 RepID=A0A067SEB4_GALM3|nr:hypothetical protein GALMADRAFT_1208270 [Galerina marginata CBS 339.88]
MSRCRVGYYHVPFFHPCVSCYVSSLSLLFEFGFLFLSSNSRAFPSQLLSFLILFLVRTVILVFSFRSLLSSSSTFPRFRLFCFLPFLLSVFAHQRLKSDFFPSYSGTTTIPHDLINTSTWLDLFSGASSSVVGAPTLAFFGHVKGGHLLWNASIAAPAPASGASRTTPAPLVVTIWNTGSVRSYLAGPVREQHRFHSALTPRWRGAAFD